MNNDMNAHIAITGAAVIISAMYLPTVSPPKAVSRLS
jgi:hypothetical protein